MRAQLHNCELDEARAAAVKFLRETRRPKATGPAAIYERTNYGTPGPSMTPLRHSRESSSPAAPGLKQSFGRLAVLLGLAKPQARSAS